MKYFGLVSRDSTFAQAFRLFSLGDRSKMIKVAFVQIVLGFVDLFGVALVGVIGTLAISAVSGSKTNSAIAGLLKTLNLDQLTLQNQIIFISLAATAVFVFKTIFSIYFSRKILYYLSARGAIASNQVISNLLNQDLLFLQKRTSQEYLYSVTQGMQSISLGVVGASISLIADLSSTLVLLIGIGFVEWTIAFGATIYFALLGYFLYLMMHKRAENLGSQSADLQIRSSNKLLEVLNTHREARIRGRINYYVSEISEDRLRISRASAEMFFMPNISKYVIETGVIVGAVLVAFSQFLITDASNAVLSIAVFMAAGLRIAPAILRLQQGVIGIRSSLGSAKPTLELIELLLKVPQEMAPQIESKPKAEFISTVFLENVSFTYPDSSKKALDSVSLQIEPGTVFAIVGSSGSGKTTLVDTLLGVISPNEGTIRLSGKSPSEVISTWPGLVAYVPQNVVISDGTIQENLALGFDTSEFSTDMYQHALELAQLDEFVSGLPLGLKTLVGENGAKLSGGQRQRVGIARALMTNPTLIVLDEATSSLDSATESSLSEAILRLRGNVTLVIIAHRLSTVRSADKVLYLQEGRSLSTGTFEQVRREIPEFNHQAKLLGME